VQFKRSAAAFAAQQRRLVEGMMRDLGELDKVSAFRQHVFVLWARADIGLRVHRLSRALM